MGPKRSISRVSNASESAPERQTKVKTPQEKVELLDELRSVKFGATAARFCDINEARVRDIKKKRKEIKECVAALHHLARRLCSVPDSCMCRA